MAIAYVVAVGRIYSVALHMTREQQLERALRDCVMQPGPTSRAAALKLLKLDGYGNPIDNEPTFCGCCGRMKYNHYGALCGACQRD